VHSTKVRLSQFWVAIIVDIKQEKRHQSEEDWESSSAISSSPMTIKVNKIRPVGLATIPQFATLRQVKSRRWSSWFPKTGWSMYFPTSGGGYRVRSLRTWSPIYVMKLKRWRRRSSISRSSNNFYERLRSLNFYLSSEQCNVINELRWKVDDRPWALYEARGVYDQVQPDPEMSDSYFLDDSV